MSFRLPKDARDWFQGIDDRTDGGAKFRTLFDRYFLCAMAGLTFSKRGQRSEVEDTEIIDHYPHPYDGHRAVIAALLIKAEMERKGLQPEDRDSIQSLMLDMLDYHSSTLLSRNGHAVLDEYAVGGMQIIRDRIPKTTELETFLEYYYNELIVAAGA